MTRVSFGKSLLTVGNAGIAPLGQAFGYFVTDGGGNGTDSTTIGIDTVAKPVTVNDRVC